MESQGFFILNGDTVYNNRGMLMGHARLSEPIYVAGDVTAKDVAEVHMDHF